VIDVINAYKERWIPSEQGGMPVKSYRKQPVTFIISEAENACTDEPDEGPIL
jgi:hypothetical protein